MMLTSMMLLSSFLFQILFVLSAIKDNNLEKTNNFLKCMCLEDDIMEGSLANDIKFIKLTHYCCYSSGQQENA